MKHPPVQMTDTKSLQMIQDFISGNRKASEPVTTESNSNK